MVQVEQNARSGGRMSTSNASFGHKHSNERLIDTNKPDKLDIAIIWNANAETFHFCIKQICNLFFNTFFRCWTSSITTIYSPWQYQGEIWHFIDL